MEYLKIILFPFLLVIIAYIAFMVHDFIKVIYENIRERKDNE